MGLKLTFSDVYDAVAEFAGWGSSPTATNVTKAKNFVYRGYRKFLWPAGYTWSFLKQSERIQIESGKWRYDLPVDFEQMTISPTFVDAEGLRNPEKTTAGRILSMYSRTSATSYPTFYAIRESRYSLESGSRKEIIFWPEPGSNYCYEYEYLITPPKPVNDSDYFVGGAAASECILQCSLSMVEMQGEESGGEQTVAADKMIASLIEKDKQEAPDTVGFFNPSPSVEQNVNVQLENVRAYEE